MLVSLPDSTVGVCIFGSVCDMNGCTELTLNRLVLLVKLLNSTTHSLVRTEQKMAEFCSEIPNVKSKLSWFRQRMKSKLSLASDCVEAKHCQLCMSFTSELHSLCGVVWCRTLSVKLSL